MKRRDITLGEMQDECKMHTHCGGCSYANICFQDGEKLIAPNRIDLADPPRFTEAQMTLLKAMYDVGVRQLIRDGFTSIVGDGEGYIGNIVNDYFKLGIKDGETLNLADLFGKEGA